MILAASSLFTGLVFLVLIRTSYVQTRIVNTLTQDFTDFTQQNISIQDIELGWNGKLKFKKFYLEDRVRPPCPLTKLTMTCEWQKETPHTLHISWIWLALWGFASKGHMDMMIYVPRAFACDRWAEWDNIVRHMICYDMNTDTIANKMPLIYLESKYNVDDNDTYHMYRFNLYGDISVNLCRCD